MAITPAIVYLDVEDEITSAATRIRQAPGARVALVIPYGSRVATSRINFKLLTREAMINGKRLDIVAPDASARALAAAAGIPVFGSVGEYESMLAGPDAPDAPTVATSPVVAAGIVAGPAAVDRAADADAPRPAASVAAVHVGREIPVGERRRSGPRRGLVVGLLVLVLAVAVAGVAAYLFLPAADITVTPQIEAVGPVGLVVRADPEATAVDEDAGVIPAQTLQVPVEVSGDFPATGKRVERTAASGAVRFTNCDPSSAYTIPRGTLVRTSGGQAFAIDEGVFLPVAILDFNGGNADVKCQSSEVAVTAAEKGTAGNVDAGSIRVVPARYNRNLVRVTNRQATSGGARQEFTRVSQKDVDAALASLQESLGAQFQTQLENPEDVPAGSTVFPETGVLGEARPTVDPATLVNQEVESFTLGLTADGSVLAVDTSPVEVIAEAALVDAVTPGYELVDGSTQVNVGDATVTGGTVSVPVAASAKQLRPVDGEALRMQVVGLPEDDARAILEPYGEVEIALWPGYVVSVPTLAQRVTLTLADPVDRAPDAAPVPPSPMPTGEPSGSPDGELPSQPLPSP